mmetsp:Transcript_56332/g.65026  ORF Transcript_56332/g.65026 Transcript_56332/m.65026 type:complete len:84 (+) Transcript_56332:56-307(+)
MIFFCPSHVLRLPTQVMDLSSKQVNAGHPFNTPENNHRPSFVWTREAKKSSALTGNVALRGLIFPSLSQSLGWVHVSETTVAW